MTEVTKIEEVVDLSPMTFEYVPYGSGMLHLTPPLTVNLRLEEESKQTIGAIDESINLYAFAPTREDLADQIAEHLVFLWRSYALEDVSKLSPKAKLLRIALLVRIQNVAMNDNAESTLAIDIHYSQADQLEMLHAEFSPHTLSRWHHARHAVQENGEGLYLIAWHGHVPVGHYLLRWNGPDTDPSGKYPYPTPYLEAGLTKDAYRRKGVASSIMRAAENLAREKGFHRIGLAVGARTNPEARRLYEGLGFQDWGQGELLISWEDLNNDNAGGIGSEVCIYMFKNISCEGART